MSKKLSSKRACGVLLQLAGIVLACLFSQYADDLACLSVKFYEDNFGMSLINKSVNEFPTYSPLHQSTQFDAYEH